MKIKHEQHLSLMKQEAGFEKQKMNFETQEDQFIYLENDEDEKNGKQSSFDQNDHYPILFNNAMEN